MYIYIYIYIFFVIMTQSKPHAPTVGEMGSGGGEGVGGSHLQGVMGT